MFESSNLQNKKSSLKDSNSPNSSRATASTNLGRNHHSTLTNVNTLSKYRRQFSKTLICGFYLEGRCKFKDESDCTHAHSIYSLEKPPNLDKTKLCPRLGECQRGKNCRFAHSTNELRATDGFYKTRLCQYYLLGGCKLGDKCRHAHYSTELRNKEDEDVAKFARIHLMENDTSRVNKQQTTATNQSPMKPMNVLPDPSGTGDPIEDILKENVLSILSKGYDLSNI